MATPGIWLLENYWSDSYSDVRSVEPVIKSLERAKSAKVVHRQINDVEDLVKGLLVLGQKRNKRYEIAYIACHGSPGAVQIGDDSRDLSSLADELPEGQVLDGKLVHFGSCSVLRNRSQCRAFLDKTGAQAVSGFTKDVDWFESMAFELLMFQKFATYQRLGNFVNGMERDYGQLSKKLGFKIIRP